MFGSRRPAKAAPVLTSCLGSVGRFCGRLSLCVSNQEKMKIQDILTKYTELSVVFLSTLLSSIIAKLVYNFFLMPLYEAKQGREIIQICALLLGLLLISVSYLIYLYFFKIKQKAKIETYEHLEKIGIYKNKSTGQLYCGSCLIEDVESPLIAINHGWFCQRKGCGRQYADPDNPQPIKPPVLMTTSRLQRW
jgi:hypothetical protein